MLYSTLLGGNSIDQGRDIAVDSAGNIYVTGQTSSTDFPTTAGAFQRTLGLPGGNAFIVKYTASGALAYASYYGTIHIDFGAKNAVGIYATTDAMGNGYIGGTENDSIFLLKLSSSGLQKLYSFPLNNITRAVGMLLDNNGNLYVTGYTSGGWTATAGAVQLTNNSTDAYVLKLNVAGALTYFTYLGGSLGESGVRLTLDIVGNIYVVGWTISSDFPTRNFDFAASAERARNQYVYLIESD